MAEKKEFRMNGKPRENLASWLKEQFPDLPNYISSKTEYTQLVERVHEVHEAALTVLELTLKSKNIWLKNYYEDDLERLKSAYGAKDLAAYTKEIAGLVKAIEEEDK
ncbi:hypothetical protein KA107_02640 [Candidatus Pacearchaeota archaeon]|nr:hypothetical protein [Candidatus Pacearchaeota archaeon]